MLHGPSSREIAMFCLYLFSLLALSALPTAATLPSTNNTTVTPNPFPFHNYIEPIDATHDLRIFRWGYVSQDKPYIAALVSASTQNFAASIAAFPQGGDFRHQHFSYKAYGIELAIENSELLLTYEVMNGAIDALTKFLMEKKMSTAQFLIRELNPQTGRMVRGLGAGNLDVDPWPPMGRNGTVAVA